MAETFEFDNDLQGWGIWGEGEGRHVKGIGKSNPGSILLQNSTAKHITLNKKFLFKKGRYKVTAWIRALDIQVGKYGNSLLLFYNIAGKTIFPTKTIHGTFEWSKISYTIDTSGGWSNVWFRLASRGSAWFDDITIEPYSGDIITFTWEKNNTPFPIPNKVGEGVRCPNCYRWMKKSAAFCTICGEKIPRKAPENTQKISSPLVLKLIDFEESDQHIENKRHNIRSYNETLSTSGKRSGKIKLGKYNNLKINDKSMHDWSNFDYFALDVFNPFSEQFKFAVAIGDQNSGGYWNQLNHYSTLTPGWNKLRFQLNRYVGERGAVRIKRYLNKSNIKRVWFGVEPETKKKVNDTFLVDNIRLEKAPSPPESFAGLMTFDFVKNRIRTQPGFTGIEMQNSYHADVGFGFQETKFWRAHDSRYMDTLYRDGIFVNKGAFRVDLPNGKYLVRLVYDGLGEWYEHFWTYRQIAIQDNIVLSEKRSNGADYLDDFLRFQDIEPKPEDNVFDLYVSKIFKPLEKVIEIKNNKLEITFEGDDSGIMLNSLIIFPIEKMKKAEKFLAQLYEVRKDEYNTISRRLYPNPFEEKGAIQQNDYNRGFYTALIDENIQLRHNHIYKSQGKAITLKGGRLQRPVQAVMVRNLGENRNLKITPSHLQSKTGDILEVEESWVRYGVNQFQSHTHNHETYELAPRFLRHFPLTGKSVEPLHSLLIWYQIPIARNTNPGTYTGNLVLDLGGKQVEYPVELKVLDFTLPEPDIAVGFFGLDPVHLKYFKGDGVNALMQNNRLLMLKELHSRGFTTWSSLPPSRFVVKNKDLHLEADGVDVLMNQAREIGFSQPVFTYGGSFPVILDKYDTIQGIGQKEYRLKTSSLLKQHIQKKKWLPVNFSISDEAAGYSQQVERDKKRVEMLQKYFPYLGRNGFSRPIKKGEYGADLNLMLTDLSLSSINKQYVNVLKKNDIKWGLYNQAIGLFTNNRVAFGVNLFNAKKMGADHYLEWSFALAQNYPYFDLDGRENDAMMVFPRTDGSFDYALKFEWATQGLEDYRLLMLAGEPLEKENSDGNWGDFRETLYRKILAKKN
jgi:hypothetical protein